MAHLTLAGLSDDGKRLLLVSDKGVEFTLDVDARLRAALRGEQQPLGQLETKMDSALRPRDIQARIRSGETPEAVAQAAQTTVDRIMAFAAPVLAERQHVADRAQRSSVRRRGGEQPGAAGGAGGAGGARTLGDVVAFHLRSLNVDPATVNWDAWRREDGRWSLVGDFSTSQRSGQATFAFDPPGNYVVAENEEARWLLGEQVEKPVRAGEPARDDLQQARQRRLSALAAEELPLGDELGVDAIELVAEQPAEAFLDEPVAAPARPEPQREPQPEPERLPEPAAEAAPEPEPAAEPEPERPRRPAKRKGRASVPSWDEIMFGGGKGE